MSDVIRVIVAEISIKKKDILGIIGIQLIFLFLTLIFNLNFSTFWIMSFTSASIIMETQFFKEKKNRFSGLPISRIKIFLIEAFRMSSLVIFLNIIYVLLLGLFDFPNNEYLTQNNVINYTVGYFGVSQFIIMYRHIKNSQLIIYEQIIAGVFYTAYVIAIVLLTHFIIDNYVIDANYFEFIVINYITVGIFISLLLPANYLIFNTRGDYLT